MFVFPLDGVDYIGIRETFTFEAGQNVSSVEVNLTEDDEIYETFKNFSLRITSSDFNVEVTNDVVTVHIVDNDGKFTNNTFALCSSLQFFVF